MADVGRPEKYDESYNEQARKLCLLGATDKELADFFEVDESTINRWKLAHPEFCASIKSGKQLADAEVAGSLYKRARGYQYDEVTFEKVDGKAGLEATEDGDIKEGDTYKKKIVTKEVAPDVTAQIFWLKNRKSDTWRDKQHVEHGGTVTNVNVTAEEAKEIAAALNKEV